MLYHQLVHTLHTRLSRFRTRSIPEEAYQLWTMRNGEQVRICDMTHEHLRHAILYQNKNLGAICPEHHGITPSQFYTLFPLYDVMRREADRRHLSWS